MLPIENANPIVTTAVAASAAPMRRTVGFRSPTLNASTAPHPSPVMKPTVSDGGVVRRSRS